MRLTIVGAGAIGGFIAAVLARGGVETAVVVRGEQLSAIRRHGLRVRSSDLGAFSAQVDAAADVRELPASDAYLLTFKAHQWPGFLEQMAAVAQMNVPIVTLQNGVPFWFERDPPLETVDPGGRLGALFGDERVIGGVVHVSGHLADPGVIVQSGGLRYLIGEATGHNGERIERLARTLRRAGLDVEIDGAIRRSLWFKLVGNASLNPMSVVTRMTIGQMMRDPSVLGEIRALMLEVLEVGKALGLVENPEREAEDRIAYAARLDDVKSSMLQDAEADRSLEIDPIVGAAIELGKRYDVPMPREQAMYARLRAPAVR